MDRPILLLGLLGAAMTSGCTEGLTCTASVEPAVVVEIRDALDDAPIAAGATGRIREGGFSDSLRAYDVTETGTLLSRAGADEREGTYLVASPSRTDRPGRWLNHSSADGRGRRLDALADWVLRAKGASPRAGSRRAARGQVVVTSG